MPLTEIQRLVVPILRPFRSAQDYVGGGAALNQNWPRLSDDMDIFRDSSHRFPKCIAPELQALRDRGFAVDVTTNNEWMVEAILRQYGFETRVQGLNEPETCRRFFPAISDEELGFRLHQADVAVNKLLCASRRRQAPRDAVDLVNIVRRFCPLGPLVWAATAKSEGLSPAQVIRNTREIAFGYADEEIRAVRLAEGEIVTRAELREVLDRALMAARDFCDDLAPSAYTGHLFVNSQETPVEADAQAVASGSVQALPLTDFASLPKLS